MSRFRWTGRTRNGQEIRAEMEAPSKEHVLVRLREQHITVTKIEAASEGGEPPDPDSLHTHAPLDARQPGAPSSPPAPRPFRGLLMSVPFLAGAVALWRFAPDDVPRVFAAVLMGFGLLILAMTILSLFEGPTKAIQEWAERQRKASRNRRGPDDVNRRDTPS
jgi:hypothetical protein